LENLDSIPFKKRKEERRGEERGEERRKEEKREGRRESSELTILASQIKN
jgi:hypothetical protein